MKLLILLHNKRVGLLIDIAEKFFLFIIKKQHTPYIIALREDKRKLFETQTLEDLGFIDILQNSSNALRFVMNNVKKEELSSSF